MHALAAGLTAGKCLWYALLTAAKGAHVCKVQVHKNRLGQDHAMLPQPCTGC